MKRAITERMDAVESDIQGLFTHLYCKRDLEEKLKEARQAFLGQRITALRIDQSQISLLQNNGVKTVGDFLRQTEERFSQMRTKNGMTFTSQFMMLRNSLLAKLEGM